MIDKRKNKLVEVMRHVKMPPCVLEYSGNVADLASTIAGLVAGCLLDGKTMSGPEAAIVSYHQGWNKEEKDLLVQSLKMNDVWRGAV